MSITLKTYPVTIDSGKINNIFAGHQPVEIEFERVDISINSVSSGVDNQILIEVTGDLTGNLNVGEWIYLYAVGTTYTYDGSFQIIDINFNSPDTEITIAGDFIEVSNSGFLNYKQNYFVECKLVDVDNNMIRKYNSNINDDGTPNGIVTINVSQVVDFLNNEILQTSGVVSNNANRFQLMYREVFREDITSAFVLLDELPIIITKAADNSEIESFACQFETPKIWVGYPFNLSILHSPENNSGLRLSVDFDELDINETEITTANLLANFGLNFIGFGQASFLDNTKVLDSNTKFIRFNLKTNNLADYDPNDYNSSDYLTI